MKRTIVFLLPLAVLATVCLAANPTPEQKALATRQGVIRKAFTDAIKARDYAGAEKSAAELLATVSDPAGSQLAAGDAALFIGSGFANPLNLRSVEIARKYLAQAEKEAAQPIDRLQAKYKLCCLNLRVGTDADYEKDVAALRDCLKDADGVKPDQLVRLILDAANDDLIPGYDYLAAAKNAAGDDVAGLQALGSYGLRYMNKMFAAGSLDSQFSREAQLELNEKLIAHPEIKDKTEYIRNKYTLLSAMGKADEAEKYLLGQVAATNVLPEACWYAELSRFYFAESVRYFDVREPSLVKKAAETGKTAVRGFVKMAENKQRPSRFYNSVKTDVADICIAAKDFDGANEILDMIIADGKGATNAFVSARFGDIAWAKEDYAAAARHYEAAGEGLDLPRHEKCARAYCALERYAEALPHLEFCSKKGNKYTRQYYSHCYESVKAKAGK